MAKELKEFIQGCKGIDTELPLIHNTNSYYFIKILESGELLPTPCKVFGENLLYFFYGRPAYKVTSKTGINDISLPICFILKKGCVKSIKRIYPFDTGAFELNIYNDYINEHISKECYILDSIDDVCKLIDNFFDNTTNYYYGEVGRSKKTIKFCDMEVKAYYELLKANGKNKHDDRRYSIEIQTDKSIKLKDCIDAIILPRCALNDERIYDVIINEWKATPITYSLYNGSSVSGYNISIREKLEDYFIDNNIIEGDYIYEIDRV